MGGQPSDASIEQQDNFDLKRSPFIRRLLRYTFPEHVAYKFDKLKEGEDPSKILSIPATWVVAANAIGNIGKIHTWDHAAVYLSGHEVLPDTLEKLRNFSRGAGETYPVVHQPSCHKRQHSQLGRSSPTGGQRRCRKRDRFREASQFQEPTNSTGAFERVEHDPGSRPFRCIQG